MLQVLEKMLAEHVIMAEVVELLDGKETFQTLAVITGIALLVKVDLAVAVMEWFMVQQVHQI